MARPNTRPPSRASSSRPGAYSPARSAPTTLPASPKPGIYLFHGDDDYGAEQALSQIRRVIAEDPSLAELNTQTLEAKDLPPEQLVDAVAAWPAFNPYRLVIVKGLALSFEPKGGSESFARKLTKAEQERARRFVAALESRSDGTFVVLLDPSKLGRRKADPNPIVAAVSESGTVLQFSELRDADLHNWIRAHAGGRVKLGDPADEERACRLVGKITDEAVVLLEQRIGPGLRQLLSELDKLRDYAGDREITERDVRLLVSETRQDTVFELVDAVAKLQTPRALTLVHRLLEAGEPAMLIIALLIRQFRGLLKVFDRASRGLPDYEAVQGTGLPSWKARELVAAARFLGRARLHEAIRTLHDVDLALKRGEIRDQFAAELLVLRLTSRRNPPSR